MVLTVVFGGVKEVAVADAIMVPPKIALELLEYHWYAKVPDPVAITDKLADAVPEQIVCVEIGFVEIAVKGFTITSETDEVNTPHEDVTTQ